MKKEKDKKPVSCFTYEVKMIIQVLADDEPSAKDKLDKEGGYMTKRDVVLKDSVVLFNGEGE
jgi:hypothetical protein